MSTITSITLILLMAGFIIAIGHIHITITHEYPNSEVKEDKKVAIATDDSKPEEQIPTMDDVILAIRKGLSDDGE